MSLILEALRKSEAERQRGRPPALPQALAAPARPRRQARWAWLLLLPPLAIGAWAWQWPRPPAGASSPAPVVPAAPAAAATVDAAPPAATGTSAPLPRREPAPPPRPQALPRQAAAPTPAADSPAPAAMPAAPAEAAVAEAPPMPDARPLAALDAASRAALPPLRLSMHVWSEQPAQRFALIDGQRLGEGARLGEVTIETIERDAVILSWRGERLRLARP